MIVPWDVHLFHASSTGLRVGWVTPMGGNLGRRYNREKKDVGRPENNVAKITTLKETNSRFIPSKKFANHISTNGLV